MTSHARPNGQPKPDTNPKAKTAKPKAKPRRPRGVGVVAILVGMLVMSGGMRLFSGYHDMRNVVSAAFAAEQSPPVTLPTAECAPLPVELAEAFRQREERIERREAELAAREGELKLATELIDARLIELNEAEASLASTIARVDGAAEADLTRLASVYENMKPKEAALLFEEMEPAFAAGFLMRLRPETAAAILAGMDSENAYVISLVLAGRNANAPTR